MTTITTTCPRCGQPMQLETPAGDAQADPEIVARIARLIVCWRCRRPARRTEQLQANEGGTAIHRGCKLDD